MFEWFFSGDSGGEGLKKMHSQFGQMLDSGKHVFETAANAYLGGTDLGVIREDLFSTDKRINKAEQKIRKELVVHATIHGASVFPNCLVLMSVVKDAERIGDYGKNLFDLAEHSPQTPEGIHRDKLISIKDEITSIMAETRVVFDDSLKDEAKKLIMRMKKVEDICDDQICYLVQGNANDPMGPSYTLAYRYFKRVTSHMKNIASSVIQPVHIIDFTSKIGVEEGRMSCGKPGCKDDDSFDDDES